jgi:hypothetical protein
VIEERYRARDAEFRSLIDRDASQAIVEARRMAPDDVLDADLTDSHRAGILIDAGARVQDKAAIDEGIAILRRLISREERPDRLYCLGNGLVSLSLLHPFGEGWYWATAALRREARAAFVAASNAAAESLERELWGRITTNLGNALVAAHRWLEGYDAYRKALRIDPSNVIAATGAAKVLQRRAAIAEPEEGQTLATLAAELGLRARGQEGRARELGGASAVQGLQEFLEAPAGTVDVPDLAGRDDYERFIARHRLALRPVIEGGLPAKKRLDVLRIRSVVERLDRKGQGKWRGVPPIFAMFNTLKSDYLSARYLAFIAEHGEVPETGSYADTLDYAAYGVSGGLQILAQRASLDLLDKIAVAVTEYLGLQDKPEAVKFHTRWLTEDKQGRIAWSPTLAQLKLGTNPGAIALAELSLDLGKKGALADMKALRHAGTHRFIVTQDMGLGRDEGSPLVEYREAEDVRRQTIETLQLARAALFYFVDLVEHEEQRRTQGAAVVPHLHVPDHHWVRGEDDEAGD